MRKDIPTQAYSPVEITNPTNQLVADKFQFFADHFKLVCLKSGEYYHYEVETHISILEHLMFYANGEIESDKKDKKRIKYTIQNITFILKTHPLFQKEDGIISIDKERYNQIRSLINQIIHIDTFVYDKLQMISQSIEDIKKLIAPSYLNDIVNSLFSMVNCSHTLNHHKKGFEYLAKLVFSHFYLKGHSRDRISGFINRLLDNKIYRQEERMYTDAPLPEKLYQRLIKHNKSGGPFDQKLFNDIQFFLTNRDLKQQIDGLIFLDRYNKYPFTFIFRVDGILIRESEFELMGIQFIQIKHFINQYSKKQLEYTDDFFSLNNRSVLTKISTEAYTQDDAVYLSLKSLREKLAKIARRIKGHFSISQEGYTFPISEQKGEKFWINPMPELCKLSKYDAIKIQYFEHNINKSPHKKLYVQLEAIITEAYIENNINLSLHYYRKFMQTLFEHIDTSGISAKNGIPKEIRVIALLLMYFERKEFKNGIRLWAQNRVIASMQFGNIDSINKFEHRIQETHGKIPINELIENTDQEHTIHEARKAIYYSKKVDEKKAYDYYVRQLLFIKQYRDKHEHANNNNDQIARKLHLYSYKIMNRLLANCFKELNRKKHKDLTHSTILRSTIDANIQKFEST